VLAMGPFHRYSGLEQRIVAKRFESLDEGLVSPTWQSKILSPNLTCSPDDEFQLLLLLFK